jgi:hypothetical protein
MSLQDEVKDRKKEFKTDGYPMSIGEIMNLYENDELVISPSFQRFFRWSLPQKARFIESILLGIPIPAIFVYQRADGIWELVDGLQRISTILEFTGKLKSPNGSPVAPLRLQATKLLPSLDKIVWDEIDDNSSLPKAMQLDFKRSKIKVEIIQKESDANAKFEVFQRLNTGGTFLSEQEVRNCLLIMLNPTAMEWLEGITRIESFQECVPLTERAVAERYDMELALKYLALSKLKLDARDVSEFLTDAIEELFVKQNIASASERERFEKLFSLLRAATGDATFRRFTGDRFLGRFMDSAFEPIALGLGANLDSYDVDSPTDIALIQEKIKTLWQNAVMQANAGSGSNAKLRIPRLVELGIAHFELSVNFRMH